MSGHLKGHARLRDDAPLSSFVASVRRKGTAMFALRTLYALAPFEKLWELTGLPGYVALAAVLVLVAAYVCLRHIPNNYVGVVEKLWSREGSLAEGSIIALNGEAGFQADLLRG